MAQTRRPKTGKDERRCFTPLFIRPKRWLSCLRSLESSRVMSKALLGFLLCCIASSLLVFGQAKTATKPPVVYVDKGACPFECCTYRRWKTEKTTTAYAQPDRKAKVVGKFKAGSRV